MKVPPYRLFAKNPTPLICRKSMAVALEYIYRYGRHIQIHNTTTNIEYEYGYNNTTIYPISIAFELEFEIRNKGDWLVVLCLFWFWN